MRLARLPHLPVYLGHSLAGLLLLFYSYVIFFDLPNVGFAWDPGSGRVLGPNVEGRLQADDQLIQVGGVTFEAFHADQRLRLFQDARPGQTLEIVFKRQGQVMTATVPVAESLTWPEAVIRIRTQWFLGWIFFLCGTLTLVLVRPRDDRWRLLIAFHALTALNLVTIVAARDHAAESAIVGRMVIWLSVPVYWHLHLIFPTPLRRLPRGLWTALYAGAGLMGVAEWLRIPPNWAYQAALLVALLGLLIPNLLRLFIPGQGRVARYVWGLAGLALLPTILLGVASWLLPAEANAYSFLGVVLAWPALPAAYFLAAYRRQLGGLETRASRAIGLYLYTVIASVLLSVVLLAFNARLSYTISPVMGNTLVGVLGSLAAVWFYGPFQHWVEHYLLGLRAQPRTFIATYSNRLTASPDREHLTRLLRDDLLPGLLVRQSALLGLEPAGPPTVLYAEQAPPLPGAGELRTLLAEADRHRPIPETAEQPVVCPWVRVALPLRQGGQTIGIWLLGRRDPDNYYFQSEIDNLRILTDQIAIALAHILQAERLRQLLQANVDRDEQERAQWALHLHDDILNELALLAPGPGQPAETTRAYERVVARVRQMISGLRPPLLAYGLRSALEQLADDLAERAGSGLTVEARLSGAARYPPAVEQYLFRIVQQAGENTVKHAQARTLRLTAALDDQCAELTVEDDGRGLAGGVQDDLADLIAKRHFGLASMFERAAFINADLRLSSGPGAGTRITVTWQAPAGAQPR